MSERKKIVPTILAAFLGLMLAAAAVSCTSIGLTKDEKGKEVLTSSIEAFNHAFRWEDHTAAAVFVPSGKKEQYWNEVDNFKGKIKIIDIQIRDIDHVEDGTTATAVLNVQYYRPESPILQTATFSQKWFFSEKEKGWQIGQSGYQAMSKQPTGM